MAGLEGQLPYVFEGPHLATDSYTAPDTENRYTKTLLYVRTFQGRQSVAVCCLDNEKRAAGLPGKGGKL